MYLSNNSHSNRRLTTKQSAIIEKKNKEKHSCRLFWRLKWRKNKSLPSIKMKRWPRLIYSQVTLYILTAFLYSTISTTIKINSPVENTSAHWVVGVGIEWFLSIFNDCFCSTVIEDGENSFYLLSNSLYPPCFFVQIMNDSIGTGRIIDCLKKETSFSKST